MSRRTRSLVRVLALTLVAVAVWPAIIAAVYVTPTAIFIDHNTPGGEVTVGNSGDTPEEATIEIKFGFPDTDSAGTPYIRFVEDPGDQFPSAANWIRPFPQRVRLDPGTQQVVRLLARPPENLPDGEYWARMIVTGRGAQLRLPTTDSTVRAGVSVDIRLIVGVTYRKGRVSTGAEIRALSADAEGDSVSVWTHLARTGNAAWLGTADVELVDLQGAIVRQRSVAIAVHLPMRRRFTLPLKDVAAGDYRVRFRLRAERSDVPKERVLLAPVVVDSVGLRIE